MTKSDLEQDPRVAAALREMRELLQHHYPEATFSVKGGDDPEGVYLIATVDVEDTDEVVDIYVDRLVDLQIEDEEGLPVYVIPVRPRERVLSTFRSAKKHRGQAFLPAMAEG